MTQTDPLIVFIQTDTRLPSFQLMTQSRFHAKSQMKESVITRKEMEKPAGQDKLIISIPHYITQSSTILATQQRTQLASYSTGKSNVCTNLYSCLLVQSELSISALGPVPSLFLICGALLIILFPCASAFSSVGLPSVSSQGLPKISSWNS